MKTENKYCTRCKRTTKFQVEGEEYTCTSCGVVGKLVKAAPERDVIGDPFHAFRLKPA
jgi:DNA-directed RNA polymerase subunit RPC12/RpoP